MRPPKITKKLVWLPVLAGLLLCGTVYRIVAAGGANGTATSTSNNLRQPIANTNGLVAWYPLDGDAKDYSGNHLDGTPAYFTYDGTTNGWMGGKFGKALLFNGSTDYVSAPVLNTIYNAAFSLSMWVRPIVYACGGLAPFAQDGAGYLNLVMCGNGIRFEFGKPNVDIYSSGSNPIPLNVWSQVVATYDPSSGSNNMKVYINGKFDSQATNATGSGAAGNTLTIGSRGNGANGAGSVDDVRIYNRALSASEISSLYAGSPSPNCDQTCNVWLKFDDNTGTAAKDSVGSHPGTLNGTASWTTGNFASAVQLDGSTGYVSVPDLGMASGTVDMWINPASVSGDQRLLAQGSGSAAQAGQIALNQSSGENGSLWTWDGSAWQRLAPDGTVKAGQWNQIVVANNGGTATAFVNGVQQLTAASAFAFSGVPANVGGKFLGSAGGTFNGSVDDFRVYSRFLAPEEIADQWRQAS